MSNSEIEEARSMFEGYCQEARNRMRDLGVPEATFHVQNCPFSGGIHIQVKRDGSIVGDLHVWSPGQTKPPSIYERLFRELCDAIKTAEDFLAYLKYCQDNLYPLFGIPPANHSSLLN